MRLARKDFESAIQDFTKALEFSDEKLVALQSRAEAYRALGKIDLAEADERKYQNEMQKDKENHRKS